MSQSLVAYVQSLPAEREDEDGAGYDLRGLAVDLLAQVRGALANNSVVVPVLQTFGVLLEADALEGLYEHVDGLKRCAATHLR